jgi:septum site-determining protein MinD
MAKITAVISGKGGVGKTTTSVNIGLHSHELGAETVVIEGNLTSPNLAHHLGQTHFPVTLHDAMAGTHPVQNAIYKHGSGLHIIPADIDVRHQKLNDYTEYGKVLQNLHLFTDHVVIDGSPGLGHDTEHLIDLADGIIIVTSPTQTAIEDAKRVIQHAQENNAIIEGVVLNKYRTFSWHTLGQNAVQSQLHVPVVATIPYDRRFRKTLNHKTPYSHKYPRRKASREFRSVAELLTNRA